MSVRLRVCLCLCPRAHRRNYTSDLCQIFPGSVLLCRRCDMLCTSTLKMTSYLHISGHIQACRETVAASDVTASSCAGQHFCSVVLAASCPRKETREVHRVRGTGGKACNAPLPCHGLRSSASPVLTATGFVNGRWQFSTPHRINTP